MKRIFALLGPVALAAGALGCTMTQKVASGAGVRAGVGAVVGGAAVPIAMSD